MQSAKNVQKYNAFLPCRCYVLLLHIGGEWIVIYFR